MKKNIILQHWDGKLPDWGEITSETVKNYAKNIGADYELVSGMPMGKSHGPHTQKLVYITEKYDSYDQTLMLDMDMFATKNYKNVFEVPRIGVLHDRAMQGLSRTPKAAPKLFKIGKPIFFGNFIKLNKSQRVSLREIWNRDEKFISDSVVDHYSGDEIVLHYLFHQSGILNGFRNNELCMRYNDDYTWRTENRWDRKFANMYQNSPSGPASDKILGDGFDPDASLIHFCRNQKKQIKKYYTNEYK